MNVPNLPDIRVPVSIDSGHMNPAWHMFFSQLIQQMQGTLSQEGLHIPQQAKTDIAKIESGSPLPSFVTEKETGDVYVAINGVFKKITTS